MAYISRQQVKTIIDNAPPGTSPEGIVRVLVKQGHTLEGLNDTGTQTTETVAEPAKKSVGGFFGNVVKSGANLVKNTVEAAANVFNPDTKKNTVANLGRVALGTAEKLVPGRQGAEDQADALGRMLKERYGSLDAIKETAYTDPVGFLLDASTVLGGGGALLKVAGKAGSVSALSRAGEVASAAGRAIDPINAVGKAVSKVGQVATGTAKFGAAQVTGLSPETITQIVTNPGKFSEAERVGLNRYSLASKVKDGIDTRLETLRDTGKVYEGIRGSSGSVVVPVDTVKTVLGKYGIGLKNGKLTTTAESVPLSTGDISAIEGFVNQYGRDTQLSANGFLNAREALSQLAKYDATKTDVSQRIARDLRSTYDDLGKKQLQGLSELDAKYAPERQFLGQIKKDYLNPNGSLKDGALNKIANLTGKGKDQTLARLEDVVPGISEDINILKALEDIELTNGQKVGAYMRGAAGGFVLSGGNPFVSLISAIVASPQIAVPILKAYGGSAGIVNQITSKLRAGTKLDLHEAEFMKAAIKAAATTGINYGDTGQVQD